MDKFQVWNLNLGRTKGITAGGGSEQNKGKFISTVLMKRFPSFLPLYLDSLPSGDEGVAAIAGAGRFSTCALEWGFAAPLLVQPLLHYSVTMSCSRTKTHWKTCPGIATTQKLYNSVVIELLGWVASMVLTCKTDDPVSASVFKNSIRPLFLLTQNKQIVY